MDLSYERYVREVISKCLCQRIWCSCSVLKAGRRLTFYHDAIDSIIIRMEFVEVQIVWNNEENNQATTYADAKTQHVYDGIIPIPEKISKGYGEVVLYHSDY